MAAVFLLLTLLHYTFYLYNPTQRANRYFARYALTYCLGMACVPYSATGPAELPSWEWGWAISVVEFGLLVLMWAVGCAGALQLVRLCAWPSLLGPVSRPAIC